MLCRMAVFAAVATIAFSALSVTVSSAPAHARATANVKYKEAANLKVGKAPAPRRPPTRFR